MCGRSGRFCFESMNINTSSVEVRPIDDKDLSKRFLYRKRLLQPSKSIRTYSHQAKARAKAKKVKEQRKDLMNKRQTSKKDFTFCLIRSM